MRSAVDYLSFRARDGVYRILEALRPSFGTLADCLTMSDDLPGVDGWKARRALSLAGDVHIAFIDHGGEHMRDWARLDMSGSGCEWVQDWRVVEALPSRLTTPEIKRLDLQVTTHDGSVTHDRVLAAFEAGAFRSPGAGRTPALTQYLSSDPTAGRTAYIGKRGQHKLGRFYEKGWEMLKDLPADVRRAVSTVAVDGVGMVPPDAVYRCEVEFRAKDGKVIPWQAVCSERDGHFAGAYPFCAELLEGVQPLRIAPVPQAAPRLELAIAMHHAARSYGGTIRAAYEAMGCDAEKVLALLMAAEPSRVLVESGALTLAPGEFTHVD